MFLVFVVVCIRCAILPSGGSKWAPKLMTNY